MILNQKKDFEYNNNNIKKNDFPEYDTINNSIDFVYNYKNQYNKYMEINMIIVSQMHPHAKKKQFL